LLSLHFSCNDTHTAYISTLSLHDALPISMPIDAEGKDEVFVGRIRKDYSLDRGINIWVVADNIRKGAATNTVQIAQKLISYWERDRKSTRLNSSHVKISYAVFCLKKKNEK